MTKWRKWIDIAEKDGNIDDKCGPAAGRISGFIGRNPLLGEWWKQWAESQNCGRLRLAAGWTRSA